MKSNCTQRYLEIIVGAQSDNDEARVCVGGTALLFVRNSSKEGGLPPLDKAGLTLTAEMHRKESSAPVILRLRLTSQIVRTQSSGSIPEFLIP